MDLSHIKVEKDDTEKEAYKSVENKLNSITECLHDHVTDTNISRIISRTGDVNRGQFQEYEVKIEYERPPHISVDRLSVNFVSGGDHSESNVCEILERTHSHLDMELSLSDIKEECLKDLQSQTDDENKVRSQRNAGIKLTSPRSRTDRAKKQRRPTFHHCMECDYKSVRRSNLKSHSLIHSGEKPFSCSACAYSSRQADKLRKHAMIHSGLRLFACGECDYSCREISQLTRHAAIHVEEKNYSCGECDFTCRQSGHLTRHAMIHSDEKHHSCGACDYTCKRADQLKRHELIHSDEKPYACRECEYTCRQIGHLRQHALIHSGDKPYSCSKCNYTCRQSNNLKRHVLIHANE